LVFKAVKSLFKKNEAEVFDESFAPSFKALMAMRSDVPYLKDFHFKKTAREVGDSKSAFKGRGIEFEEVRAYQFGDDVRDIDWRVTARKNQPFTKLYTEEKDRQVYVFLDLSAPMYFGTKGELKSVTAAKTAALLGWLALSYKDRFGLALYTGAKTYLFEARRREDYFLSILKKIEKEARQNLHFTEQTETFAKALQLFEKKVGRQAIVFLVSSFDEIESETLSQISLLAKQNEVYMVDIFDPLEALCPPEGLYNAEYQGLKATLTVGSLEFEKAYTAHFAQKREALKNFCTKHEAHYRPIKTDVPIYSQLRPV